MSEKRNLADTNAYGAIGVGAILAIMISSCSTHFASSSMQTVQALIAETWPKYADLAGLPTSCMSLCMVPPLLFMGFFTRHMSKKSIMILGSSLFSIGGLLPLVIPGFWPYLICKCILGLGVGFLSSIPITLLGFLFNGKKQATMTGILNGVASAISVLVSMLTGILGGYSLRTANYVYLIMVVIVIIQIIFLPKFPPEKKDAHVAKVDENGNRLKMGGWTILQIVIFFCWNIFAIIIIYTIATSTMRMGGTIFDIGIVSSVFTAGNFLWSLIWIALFRLFKNYILPVGCILSCVAFIMMAVGDKLPYMFAWAILCSGGMTFFYTWYYKTMGSMTPLVWVSTAVAFINVGMSLMQALSLYLFKWMVAATGSEVGAIKICAGAMIVYCVITFILATIDKKRDNAIYKNLLETKYGAVEESS